MNKRRCAEMSTVKCEYKFGVVRGLVRAMACISSQEIGGMGWAKSAV